MKRLALLLLVTIICSGFPARAQNTYELGGLFDPSTSPKFKGVASFLTAIDSKGDTLSYSSALVNKPIAGVFTYGIVTGIRHKLPLQSFGGVSLWLDIQGGAAVSPTASSGAFLGGLVATRTIKGRLAWFLSAKAFAVPVSGGGITLQSSAGFQVKP